MRSGGFPLRHPVKSRSLATTSFIAGGIQHVCCWRSHNWLEARVFITKKDRSADGRQTLSIALRDKTLAIAIKLESPVAGMGVKHLISGSTIEATAILCGDDFPVAVLLNEAGNDRHNTLRVLNSELCTNL